MCDHEELIDRCALAAAAVYFQIASRAQAQEYWDWLQPAYKQTFRDIAITVLNTATDYEA